MSFIGAIVFVIGLGFTILLIWASICAIKTYNLMQEIVDSGVVTSLLKKQAQEIINSGHSGNISSLTASLRNMSDDKEAQQLADKLAELIKSQQR